MYFNVGKPLVNIHEFVDGLASDDILMFKFSFTFETPIDPSRCVACKPTLG